MPADWFVGEGAGALVVAILLVLSAGATLAWLRGPGSEPHYPPIAHRSVVVFAGSLVVFAMGWAFRAVWGGGGFVVASGVALLVIAAYAVVRRATRRS